MMMFLGRTLVTRAAPRPLPRGVRVGGCGCGRTKVAAEVMAALGMTTQNGELTDALWPAHIAEERALLFPKLAALGLAYRDPAVAQALARLEDDHRVYLALLTDDLPLPPWPGAAHSVADHAALEDLLVATYAAPLRRMAAGATAEEAKRAILAGRGVAVSGAMTLAPKLGGTTALAHAPTSTTPWRPILAVGALGALAWWFLGPVAAGVALGTAGGAAYLTHSTAHTPPTAHTPGGLLVATPHPLPREPSAPPDLPHGAPYGVDGPPGQGPQLPTVSPAGVPWLLWLGRTDVSLGGTGLDAEGNWFLHSTFGWIKTGGPGSGSKALETLNDIAVNVVAPILGAALTMIVPGVGGIATAAMISAWRNLAKGATITDSLIGAAREQLPSLHAQETFDKAIVYAKDHGREALDKLRGLASVSDERTAIDAAQIVVTAQAAQDRAFAAMQARNPALGDRFALAKQYNAKPLDVAYALGGPAYHAWMDKALEVPP